MSRRMLIGLGLLISLVTVPLARGRLSRLADVRPRAQWLALLAIGLQILIVNVIPDRDATLLAAVHLTSYALLFAFVAANRHIAYVWLIGLGGLLNVVAIAANEGVMPADPDALRRAGLPVGGGEFENSAAVEDPRLQPLGDVFAVPESWPISNVFSVGDVLIVVGAFLAVHTICRSRLAVERFARPGYRGAHDRAPALRERRPSEADRRAARPAADERDRKGAGRGSRARGR